MYSPGAYVSAGVVSAVGVAVEAYAAFAGRMDKVDTAVGIDFGDNAHVSYSAAFARAAEEKQVAWLELGFLHFYALAVLIAAAGA